MNNAVQTRRRMLALALPVTAALYIGAEGLDTSARKVSIPEGPTSRLPHGAVRVSHGAAVDPVLAGDRACSARRRPIRGIR
jgi:hypothetical protein